MSTTTLALDATLALVTAAVYGWVGRIMLRRPAPDDAGRVALRMFALWWFSLMALTLISPIQDALALAGVFAVEPHLLLLYAALVPLAACLWGLLYYLLYIYTGNRRLLVPLGVFHLGILAFFTYLVAWLRPVGVTLREWNVQLVFEREVPSVLGSVALVLILGPVLLASLAYGTLFFRATDRTTRYRVASVSCGFLLWFGSSAAASVAGLSESSWWPIVSRVVGLVATLIILSAYRPPGFVQRAFGVAPVPRPEEEVALVPRERAAPPVAA